MEGGAGEGRKGRRRTGREKRKKTVFLTLSSYSLFFPPLHSSPPFKPTPIMESNICVPSRICFPTPPHLGPFPSIPFVGHTICNLLKAQEARSLIHVD